MNESLNRLMAVFVAPAAAEGAIAPYRHDRERGREQTLPSVAVLGALEQLPAAGAAVALALARRCRRPCALLCGSVPDSVAPGALRAPGTPAAARAAAVLRGRGQPAAASGRLVRVTLPAGPEAAAPAAIRALNAARAPAVIAVPTPRTPAVDRLLGVQDAVLLATAPSTGEGMALLAVTALSELRVPVATFASPVDRLSRARARAGLGRTRARPLPEALESVL